MSDRIDFEQVREVVRIAAESEVAELEVETPTLKVRVRKANPTPVDPVRVQNPQDLGEPATLRGLGHANPTTVGLPGSVISTNDDHLVPAVAPMVGTFYRAASADAAPFVNEGDLVDEGQVICIIEAMKLFNEIQAEVRGRVAKVLVENASPVEYGQPLFLLDTAARD
jgi:acetyl-CoA carboxylase biotin carboxyl carrier protein